MANKLNYKQYLQVFEFYTEKKTSIYKKNMIFWKGSLNSYTNTIGKKRMIYIIKTKFNYGVQKKKTHQI